MRLWGRKLLGKTLITSQFLCTPYVWMCHSCNHHQHIITYRKEHWELSTMTMIPLLTNFLKKITPLRLMKENRNDWLKFLKNLASEIIKDMIEIVECWYRVLNQERFFRLGVVLKQLLLLALFFWIVYVTIKTVILLELFNSNIENWTLKNCPSKL